MHRASYLHFSFAFTGRSFAYCSGGSGSGELVRGEAIE
jgi:hypothetical protein